MSGLAAHASGRIPTTGWRAREALDAEEAETRARIDGLGADLCE